jgi:rhodanese-related sulfurtransferase
MGCVAVVQQAVIGARIVRGAAVYTRTFRPMIRSRSNGRSTRIEIGAVIVLPVFRLRCALQFDKLEAVLDTAHQRALDLGLPYFGASTPTETQALLSALPEARLIDVRTRPEWEYVGRVPGSTLIEWNTYPEGTRNPAFLDALRAAVPNRDSPVLFLCRSGHRSDSAARAAAAAGYTKAFNVLEGFEGNKDSEGHRGNLGGWRKARLPWVQG